MLERGPLRHTPGGIPVLEFSLAHQSSQVEAGQTRSVDVEMACIVVESLALLLAKSLDGDMMRVSGFLAARSLKRRSPVLHVTHIEFMEGIQNGF